METIKEEEEGDSEDEDNADVEGEESNVEEGDKSNTEGQGDDSGMEEQGDESNVEKQGDEEVKEEVVENGEAKENELSDDPDASSPAKTQLKEKVLSSEELDVLFAKEPFVMAATMFSQNNFNTILGQLTAAIEEGRRLMSIYHTPF